VAAVDKEKRDGGGADRGRDGHHDRDDVGVAAPARHHAAEQRADHGAEAAKPPMPPPAITIFMGFAIRALPT
jgi:hypothetical protein